MTKDEAIAKAIEWCAESFTYEYFPKLEDATRAAEVMTILSNEEWITEPTIPPMGTGFWVHPKQPTT